MAARLGRRRDRRPPLTWSVVIAAPKGDDGARWGDTWFAADLVDALTRAGQRARTVFRGGATSEARESDDVVIVLRGLRRVVPRRGSATWLLWIISHPELVEEDEPAQYDAVFAASEHWRPEVDSGVTIEPLLQATNPRRFTPTAAPEDSGERILFVGSTRGEFRPAVRDCLAAGIDVSVFGVGWSQFLAPEQIRGEFIDNDVLPAAYAGAGVVLNDHWPDMARAGFLSNRLFDASACAARVLSDEATGLSAVFGSSIRTFSSGKDLVSILSEDPRRAFPDRRERLDLAERIARDHSFDARAAVLIERAYTLRGLS